MGTRTAYGQSADIHGVVTVTDMDCPRTASDADADADWMRTRPVADWTRPRIGLGLPVATDIGAAICPDKLRIHRDCFADAKTSF